MHAASYRLQCLTAGDDSNWSVDTRPAVMTLEDTLSKAVHSASTKCINLHAAGHFGKHCSCVNAASKPVAQLNLLHEVSLTCDMHFNGSYDPAACILCLNTTMHFNVPMQGREKDVIIFCAVRSNGDLGFLSDPRRLNVAMTRARQAVVLVGHVPTLMQDELWSKWVGAAEPLTS